MRSAARSAIGSLIRLSLAVFAVGTQPAAAQLLRVGGEFRVNTYTADKQAYPWAAGHGDDQFVIVWGSWPGQDGDNWGVFGQRLSGGAAVGPEFQVNTSTTGYQYYSRVASDADGNFVVVWSSDSQNGVDTDGSDIIARRFTSTGTPVGNDFRVNTRTAGEQEQPTVAVAPDGAFVIAWGDDAPPYNVRGQRYTSAGAPAGTEFPVTLTPGAWPEPAVAADGSGNIVACWSTVTNVMGQRYTSAGLPLGGEFQVNANGTTPAVIPAVAAAADGSFLIAYLGTDAGQDGVFGRRYAGTGAPLGGEFQINTTTPPFGQPRIGMDPCGDALVAWDINHGSYDPDVVAQFYDHTGAAVGGEFFVNTTTAQFQEDPAVAADGRGSFLVTWHGNGPGDNDGVFAQRFSLCGNASLDCGEECDDGNRTDGDCCSATCRFEAIGSPCPGGVCDGSGNCVTTTTTSTSTSTTTSTSTSTSSSTTSTSTTTSSSTTVPYNHPAATVNAVFPLVRAFAECTPPNANTVHDGLPSLPSCTDPVPLSQFTINPKGDFGWVKVSKVPGPDLKIQVQIRKVFDPLNNPFNGNLSLRFVVRQTDVSCSGSSCTLPDFPVVVTVPCLNGSCTITQILTAIPRTPARNFEFGRMEVYDPSSHLFMTQGAFVP